VGAARFTIDTRLDAVASLAADVRATCLTLGLDEDAASELELAVVEAATNVIRHGYGDRPGGRLEVIIGADAGGGVRAEVLDGGRPIPVGQLEQAEITFPLDDLDDIPDSGRGLALIKLSVDEWAYQSGPGGNRLTLIKRPSA